MSDIFFLSEFQENGVKKVAIDISESAIFDELKAYKNARLNGSNPVAPFTKYSDWLDDFEDKWQDADTNEEHELISLTPYISTISNALTLKMLPDDEYVLNSDDKDVMLELPDLPLVLSRLVTPDAKTMMAEFSDSQREEKPTQLLELSEDVLPSPVAEELMAYAKGAYPNTISNAERINQIADRYDTLHIELDNQTSDVDYNPVLTALDNLFEASNAFGSQDHSATGQGVIKAFKSQIKATYDAVVAVTRAEDLAENKQLLDNMKSAFSELDASSTTLQEWLATAFWQYGGKGDGDMSNRVGTDSLDDFKALMGY
ncbi:MAG: hypothetical protein ACTILZ_06415 [Leuconostoc mesenteroides]